MFGLKKRILFAVFPLLFWGVDTSLPPLPINSSKIIAPGVHYQKIRLKEPRPVLVHVVKINIDQPSLDFFVTPGKVGKQIPARKTSTFLKEFNALVAINGGTFSPHKDRHLLDYSPHEFEPSKPTALSISNGIKYSEPQDRWPVICIEEDKNISMHDTNCPDKTVHALAGVRWAVKDGEVVKHKIAKNTKDTLEPRTALALSKDKASLWMIVVDGKQPWYSEGFTQFELAKFLEKELKVYNAIELDGGGSSTLVGKGFFGTSLTLNSPTHNGIPGRERPVANHLGIKSVKF